MGTPYGPPRNPIAIVSARRAAPRRGSALHPGCGAGETMRGWGRRVPSARCCATGHCAGCSTRCSARCSGGWPSSSASRSGPTTPAGRPSSGSRASCGWRRRRSSRPFAATFADRYPRERVMAASDLGRALLCLAIAAAVAADAPPAVVLVLLVLIALLASLFEPARAAIVPSLVDRPELLTASNAVSSAVNSAAYFLGPARRRVPARGLERGGHVRLHRDRAGLVGGLRADPAPARAGAAGGGGAGRLARRRPRGRRRRPRGPRPPAAPRPVRRADADRGRPQRVHRRHRARPARRRATPGWASWTPRAASARCSASPSSRG